MIIEDYFVASSPEMQEIEKRRIEEEVRLMMEEERLMIVEEKMMEERKRRADELKRRAEDVDEEKKKDIVTKKIIVGICLITLTTTMYLKMK